MPQSLTTSPAHTVLPGTIVNKDSVVFSAVFRDCTSCGIILYRISGSGPAKKTVIPFTDKYRYGSLYSIRIEHIDPGAYAYRYYRDNFTFVDPYARELVAVKTEEGEDLTACRLFYAPEDSLPAYSGAFGRKKADWADEILYCVHVKGFTASRTASGRHRGTFLGLSDKVPYLSKLGITAVELLPVYELRPEILGMAVMDPAVKKEEEHPTSFPLRKPEGSEKTNYWNFGEGCYFAPKRSYASSGEPQREFREMVAKLHKAGIRVYLQLFFPDTVTIQTQLECARFYVTHYHIDGFHLKGNDAALKTLCSDPMLSDTAIFYYSFPYEDLEKQDSENPAAGRPQVQHLCEYTDNYEGIVRRFVKSDNGVLQDFVRVFTDVPKGHVKVHYVTTYEGFTLNDLVSYNWKHNEANGEEGRDGNDTNLSWNCGAEGKSQRKDVRTLRLRQMKNFIALNLLSQGTPLLLAGDERMNSQDGNNNPYCQDNETGWVTWKDTADAGRLYKFTTAMIAFRKAHSVFRRRTPFRFSDYRVTGYPDLSFHGKDAWKPDFSSYSHTVGILYDEHYAEEKEGDNLLYVAVNMHWHNQLLGIPAPPQGREWVKIMDTFEEQSFPEEPWTLTDQRSIGVRGRSVCILTTRPIPVRILATATVHPAEDADL